MEYINDAFETVFSTPWLLVALICLVVGYVARVLPFLPNRYIFIITTVVGGTIFPFLCSPAEVNPKVHNPIVAMVIMGLIVGFSTWVFHKLVIKRVEDKFPSVAGFFDQFDRETSPDPAPAPKV